MTVSVVIPVFNRPSFVLRAVQSVLNQTWTDLEVLVVDDGSTDNTRESLFTITDPRLKILRQEHKGVSAARNLGIRSGRGDFVAFLDSDDRWLPSKLEKQVRLLQAEPGCLLVHTEEIWFRNGKNLNPMEKHRKRDGDIFTQSLRLCAMSVGTILVRRDFFDRIGLFDEALPVCEDYDLWLRFTAFHRVRLIPEALVIREGGHPDQLSHRFRGMDRYRIRALVKLLADPSLPPSRRAETFAELHRKCRIYGHGCRKHGRPAEGLHFLSLPFSLPSALGTA